MDPREEAQVQDLFDGRLTGAEAERVRAALEADPALRDLHDDLERIREELRAGPDARAPHDFLRRVRARLADEASGAAGDDAAPPLPSLEAERRRTRPALALAAAALLVAAIGVQVFRSGRGAPASGVETAAVRDQAPPAEAEPGSVPPSVREPRDPEAPERAGAMGDLELRTRSEHPGLPARRAREAAVPADALRRSAPATLEAVAPELHFSLEAGNLAEGRADLALLVHALRSEGLTVQGSLLQRAPAETLDELQARGARQAPRASGPHPVDKGEAREDTEGRELLGSVLLTLTGEQVGRLAAWTRPATTASGAKARAARGGSAPAARAAGLATDGFRVRVLLVRPSPAR